jgi:hypothetical protein
MFARAGLGAACAAVLAAAAQAQAQVAAPAPIQAQALGGLDVFQAAARSTDLPPELWKGTSAALAAEVFGRLAGQPLSPAARDLALRLLATGAAAPDGAAADMGLAAARAGALLALGDAAGADAILDRTAGGGGQPRPVGSRGGGQPVPGPARRRVLDRPGPPRRARCDLLDPAPRLLRGAGGPRPRRPARADLAGAGRGPGRDLRPADERPADGAAPGAASLRTGLHAALSRALKLDLAPAVETAAPAALVPLATTEGPARTAAAARALRLGLIRTEARAAYAPPPSAVTIAPAATPATAGLPSAAANPPATTSPGAAPVPPTAADVAAAARLTGAARELALHRLTLAEDSAIRTEALGALLDRAEPAEFLAAAKLAEPVLRALPPPAAGARALLFARAAAMLPTPRSPHASARPPARPPASRPL